MSLSFLEVITAPSTGCGMLERKLPDESKDDGDERALMLLPLQSLSMGTVERIKE